MKLTFIGAAHEVTGSCTLLECCGGNFLIDYGMEQGVNVFENVPLPVLPGQIDVIFLTRAPVVPLWSRSIRPRTRRAYCGCCARAATRSVSKWRKA